ncbi:hypothetical protein LP7551_01708 [Roseibium album]|nr:hypothetical protein LP7551_01708 [Roseibium album]
MALKSSPESGLAHALVVLSLIEAAAFGQMTVPDLVANGQHHAEQAVALAPSCQEALFAAAALSLLQDDRKRFAVLCDQAVHANPNGTLLTSMAGTWFAMSGELERGVAMIKDALERNPMLPDWLRIPLTLGAIAEGDPQKSADLVRDLNARDVVSEWLIIAAAHGLAGNKKEAHRALLRLAELGGDPNALLKDLPLEADLFSELQKGISSARASNSE